MRSIRNLGRYVRSHRSPIFAALALILAAAPLLGLACTTVTTGPTNVNVTLVATQTFNLPAAVPSNQAGCPAISKIRVNYPETLKVNDKAPISATPLDSDGKQRAASCDDADGIQWSAQPSELLAIAAPRSFDTEASALKPGNVTLSVTVGKSGSNSVPIKVS